MGETPTYIYEFGPYRVDAGRRLLLREGKPVRLPAKAFEILLVLLEGSGRLVEKEELIRRVWPDAVVEENNLTVNISALRKCLSEGPGEHRYVVTVSGRGYQFVANVRKQDSETTAGPDQGPRLDSLTSSREREAETDSQGGFWGRRGVLFILAALVATTVILSYIVYSRYRATTSKAGITSIAVLPFANSTGDPNAEYLSDGIAESLIHSLSQLSGVKVIASNSSFQYKDKQVDLQNVARTLGVDEIVTGRVLRLGDSLIISVELVNGRDGTHLWGEQFDRNPTDVLKVQSEISRAISEKLKFRFTSGEQKQLINRVGINPQAYELLLRGRFHWRKQGLENQKKAIECYEQAIRTDPTYALAYSELSASFVVLYGSGLLDPKEFKPKAEAAVYKALELDEGLADAHYVLASLKQNDWQWSAAEQEYRRALELNPNLAEAYRFYSFLLIATGRYDDAVDSAKRARDLDPLALGTSVHLVMCLNVARRHDEAMELSLKIFEMDQNSGLAHYALAVSYAGKGMYREAINKHLEAVKLGGDSPTDQIYLGMLYAKADQRKKAQEILKQLELTTEYVSPAELAILYAALGERERAFASLERAFVAHDLQLQYLGAEPTYDTLREDARFKDLMHRTGLYQFDQR